MRPDWLSDLSLILQHGADAITIVVVEGHLCKAACFKTSTSRLSSKATDSTAFASLRISNASVRKSFAISAQAASKASPIASGHQVQTMRPSMSGRAFISTQNPRTLIFMNA
jgi:hypothetical protein